MNDLVLFLLMLAKVAVLCGFAPAAIAIALYVQVSGRAVSHNTSVALSEGNKPARKFSRVLA